MATITMSAARVPRRNPVRTTIVLPAALDQNLEIFCAKEASSKNQVVIEALKGVLKKAGLDPLKAPTSVKIDVSYT
jgi:hypothetical protein